MGIVMWYDAIVRERPAGTPRSAAAPAAASQAPLIRPAPPVLLHEEPAVGSVSAAGRPSQPSLLAALMAAESSSERQRTVATLLHALGFEWLGYGRLSQLGEHCAPLSFCTTYADRRWAERYFGEAYQEIDPRLQLALRSCLPAIWTLDQLAAQAASDVPSSRLRRFVGELADTGMRSGVMLALPGASGSERHFVSLLSRTPGSSWMSDGLIGQVLTFALCLHEFYTRYANLPQPADNTAHAGARLTSMQREILACVSRGMGDKAIAAKLGISLHNVDYHMRQLRKRFAVRNRVQLMQATQNAQPA